MKLYMVNVPVLSQDAALKHLSYALDDFALNQAARRLGSLDTAWAYNFLAQLDFGYYEDFFDWEKEELYQLWLEDYGKWVAHLPSLEAYKEVGEQEKRIAVPVEVRPESWGHLEQGDDIHTLRLAVSPNVIRAANKMFNNGWLRGGVPIALKVARTAYQQFDNRLLENLPMISGSVLFTIHYCEFKWATMGPMPDFDSLIPFPEASYMPLDALLSMKRHLPGEEIFGLATRGFLFSRCKRMIQKTINELVKASS